MKKSKPGIAGSLPVKAGSGSGFGLLKKGKTPKVPTDKEKVPETAREKVRKLLCRLNVCRSCYTSTKRASTVLYVDRMRVDSAICYLNLCQLTVCAEGFVASDLATKKKERNLIRREEECTCRDGCAFDCPCHKEGDFRSSTLPAETRQIRP